MKKSYLKCFYYRENNSSDTFHRIIRFTVVFLWIFLYNKASLSDNESEGIQAFSRISCKKIKFSGGFYGKQREIQLPSGLPAHFRRLCHRSGECVEIPLHHREIRRCCLCADLFRISAHSGHSHSDTGACRWARQSAQCCPFHGCAGAEGNEMALVQISCNGR